MINMHLQIYLQIYSQVFAVQFMGARIDFQILSLEPCVQVPLPQRQRVKMKPRGFKELVSWFHEWWACWYQRHTSNTIRVGTINLNNNNSISNKFEIELKTASIRMDSFADLFVLIRNMLASGTVSKSLEEAKSASVQGHSKTPTGGVSNGPEKFWWILVRCDPCALCPFLLSNGRLRMAGAEARPAPITILASPTPFFCIWFIMAKHQLSLESKNMIPKTTLRRVKVWQRLCGHTWNLVPLQISLSIPYDKSDGHIWLPGASELISQVGPSRQFTVDGDHHGYPGMTPRQKIPAARCASVAESYGGGVDSKLQRSEKKGWKTKLDFKMCEVDKLWSMNKAQLLFETNSWWHWIVAARNLSHLFRDLENENHPGSMGKCEALGFFQWPKFGGWARVPGKRWVEWGCTSVKSTFAFFRHPPFQNIKITYIYIHI